MPIRAPLDGPAATLVEEVAKAQLPSHNERHRIHEKAKKAKVTYRDLGSALDVDAMTVWRWEHGHTVPKREDAIRYRQLLEALDEAIG